jgi:hypothetical protein
MITAQFFGIFLPRPPHTVFAIQGGGKAGRPILQLRLAWSNAPK